MHNSLREDAADGRVAQCGRARRARRASMDGLDAGEQRAVAVCRICGRGGRLRLRCRGHWRKPHRLYLHQGERRHALKPRSSSAWRVPFDDACDREAAGPDVVAARGGGGERRHLDRAATRPRGHGLARRRPPRPRTHWAWQRGHRGRGDDRQLRRRQHRRAEQRARGDVRGALRGARVGPRRVALCGGDQSLSQPSCDR
jgi:hypothetical protein